MLIKKPSFVKIRFSCFDPLTKGAYVVLIKGPVRRRCPPRGWIKSKADPARLMACAVTLVDSSISPLGQACRKRQDMAIWGVGVGERGVMTANCDGPTDRSREQGETSVTSKDLEV